MRISNCCQHQTLLLQYTTIAVLTVIFTTPQIALAGAGHDHSGAGSFQAGGKSSDTVVVDPQTAKRLGIEVESVKNQRLDIGIKTTGQIEALPDQNVAVTAPLTSKVIQLLVQPGSRVTKGQPLAVIAAPELVDLRVTAQGKQADAQGALQKAQVNLQLAQANLARQQTIANAEVAQARTKLTAAQAQFDRDSSIVKQRDVMKVAQENLKRQQQIANAEIARSKTEVTIAKEQYDKDKELVTSGALSRRQMLESQGKLERAKADAAKARNLPQVVQAESEVKKAEVDLPYRELRESQARVAEAKAELQRAETRKDVLEAQAQLQRAKSDVTIAQSQLNLSSTAYRTRLQQLGSTANDRGLVTITAPITGTVATRDVSVGQSLQDAGGKLMTITNNAQVFAVANIYEKDLGLVKIGQKIKLKVPSLADRSFEGTITRIGTAVRGETRVVPVQAEINNPLDLLKPGMFAQLEVVTNQTGSSLLVIPTTALVEVNGKKMIYVQNGSAFQAIEPVFGRSSGDMVAVTSGLFDGDKVVTKRAMQLYAQSLRSTGESSTADDHHSAETPKPSNSALPAWVLPLGGAVVAAGTLITGGLWWKRKPDNAIGSDKDLDSQVLEVETDVDLNGHAPDRSDAPLVVSGSKKEI
jgi:cobalt-zinc-cadmium efflux system membrane fusion protein